MKASVSAAERLQLIGLLTLAKYHNEKLVDISRAALAVLAIGPDDEKLVIGNPSDHVSDAVYSDIDADELLKRIDVAVDASG